MKSALRIPIAMPGAMVAIMGTVVTTGEVTTGFVTTPGDTRAPPPGTTAAAPL